MGLNCHNRKFWKQWGRVAIVDFLSPHPRTMRYPWILPLLATWLPPLLLPRLLSTWKDKKYDWMKTSQLTFTNVWDQYYQHYGKKKNEISWDLTDETGQYTPETRKGTKQRVEERVKKENLAGEQWKYNPNIPLGKERDPTTRNTQWKDQVRKLTLMALMKTLMVNYTRGDVNNTMWIKQHTRDKRVCFSSCCCCVVEKSRVRTWEMRGGEALALPSSNQQECSRLAVNLETTFLWRRIPIQNRNSLKNLMWRRNAITQWRLYSPSPQPWEW